MYNVPPIVLVIESFLFQETILISLVFTVVAECIVSQAKRLKGPDDDWNDSHHEGRAPPTVMDGPQAGSWRSPILAESHPKTNEKAVLQEYAAYQNVHEKGQPQQQYGAYPKTHEKIQQQEYGTYPGVAYINPYKGSLQPDNDYLVGRDVGLLTYDPVGERAEEAKRNRGLWAWLTGGSNSQNLFEDSSSLTGRSDSLEYDPVGDRAVEANKQRSGVWAVLTGRSSAPVDLSDIQQQYPDGPGSSKKSDSPTLVAQVQRMLG